MLSWLVLIGPLIGGRDNVCHLVDQPTKQSLKAFLYGVAFQIALGALMRNINGHPSSSQGPPRWHL